MKLADATNKFKANSSRFMRKQGMDFIGTQGVEHSEYPRPKIKTVKGCIRNSARVPQEEEFE